MRSATVGKRNGGWSERFDDGETLADNHDGYCGQQSPC
jgi:hypothetical protein